MCDFEKIELDTENGEVRMSRSDYAQVIFRNVAETYVIDTNVDVAYNVTRYFSPSKRDWIGLYKVGWTSSKDHLYYHWAKIPSNYQQGTEYEAQVTFTGAVLPKDDDEFYQFCYVTNGGQVRGASTPFMFRHPSAEEFVEVMDSDNDIMVIKSKTSALEEQLNEAKTEKEEVLKQKYHVEKEMESYLTKLMESEKFQVSEKQEKDSLRVDLQATQDKVASLHSEVKEKTARYDILNTQYQSAKQENIRLGTELDDLQKVLQKLQAELKVMKNKVDELSGRNRSLEEEMDLYKEHVNTSSDTMKEHNLQVETLRKQHQDDEKELQLAKNKSLKLKKELNALKEISERQASVSEDDKNQITDLRTQLMAVNDQMEALHECKTTLGQEINSLMQANENVAEDLQASKSEAFSLKERLTRLEDDKERLQKTMEGEVKFLQGKLDEKTEENAKLRAEHGKLTKARNRREGDEGSMYALQMAHEELKKRLSKAEHQRSALEKEVSELHKRKTVWEVKEKEMRREIEDLKERLLMGEEEFKDKYIECKKLQQQLKKAQRVAVYSRDCSVSAEPCVATKMTETVRQTENEQTTQTSKCENERTTQTTKAESERTTQTLLVEKTDSEQMTNENTVDLSNDEIQMQLQELGQELENRCAKKLKYKRLYQEEKEKNSFVQKHYHEQVERKDKELSDLRLKLSQLEDQHMQYVRKMEDVQSENTKQKAQIAGLKNMLVEKSTAAPKVPPRRSLMVDSAVGTTGPAHATLCYGNTDAAHEIIKKVNTIATEQSQQKEGSVTELKRRAHQSTDVQNSVLQEYDPVQKDNTTQNREEGPSSSLKVDAFKQGKGSGFEPTEIVDEATPNPDSSLLSDPEIRIPPSTPNTHLSAKSTKHMDGGSTELHDSGIHSERGSVIRDPGIRTPPSPPNTHLSAKSMKHMDGGSTQLNESGIHSERGSVYRDAPSSCNIERGAHANDVMDKDSAPPQTTPREQDGDDEYYDARAATTPVGEHPSCPVCNLVFPPKTDGTILNAHANTHFNSMVASNPEPVREPQRKQCPLCSKTFPDDPATQRQYEEHVNTHFESDNYV